VAAWDFLLACDMDGTVIPLEEGAGWEADVSAFRERVVARPELCLAYVTGRDFPLALRGMEKHGLPRPVYLACDVGTSVYIEQAGAYVLDGGYARDMQEAWGGVSAGEVRERAARVAGFQLQREDRQTPFKVSYELSPSADHGALLRALEHRLGDLRDRVRVVYSVQASDGLGLLDLLPAGVAKDFAVRHILRDTGLDPDRLVYAGDSGNDAAAMLAGFKGIVVGNAPEALKRDLRRDAARRGISDRLYFAQAPYAGGVLEGCHHFGLL